MKNGLKEHNRAQKIIKAHGFHDFYPILPQIKVSELFESNDRCGIYVLKFSDSHYYIGQSIDIVKRYEDHYRTYKHYNIDIDQFSYKQVPSADLNRVEREMINKYEENNIYIKNHTFSGIAKGEIDLDATLTKEEQVKWLNNYKQKAFYRNKLKNEKQREKYRYKFEDFCKLKIFDQLIDFLRIYFKYCIPEPFSTEFDFWRLSCLPQDCLCRLNIYKQEVLSIFDDKVDGLMIKFFVSKTIPNFYELINSKVIFSVANMGYDTGGSDQGLIFLSQPDENVDLFLEKAKDFINTPSMQKAIKDFNLRLMRKGVGFNKPSHCMDLANEVLKK